MTVKSINKSGIRNGVLPRNTSSGVIYDQHGLPREGARDRGNILGRKKGKADTQGKAYLIQENNITRTELLMLKGFNSYSSIAKALGLPGTSVKQFVERVHVRWETYGNPANHRRVRGEAIQRLVLIQQKIWDLIDNGLNDQVKLAAAAQLMQVHDRLLAILGLTPEVVKKIDNSPVLEPGEDENTPQGAIKLQARLQKWGEKFLLECEKDHPLELEKYNTPWPPQSAKQRALVRV